MADQKISQLPAATTPTGAEVVPVLQGGDNKRSTALALGGPAVAAHVAELDPHPQYQTQAEGDARYATAAQGTDSREWTAATIGQAEAEAGTATTRRAFTAERVFQAIAAWWAASSAKTKLDGIAAGAEVNVNADWNASSGDAQILNKPTLGGAAALSVGTTAGTVAAGDDSRITGALSAVTAASTYQPLTANLTALGANNVAYYLARANHTGTQAFSTLTAVPCEIGIACSDETTDLTTGTAKVTFRMPYAMTLTAVRASVNTAPTGSTLIVDINEGGTSVLSTKLSIDASETTSTTAATAAVISDSALANDAEITIDIDQIGSTIAGKGLKVWLIGTRA